MDTKHELSTEERTELLESLASRFSENMKRHPDLEWTAVQTRLEAHPEKLDSLRQMEETGGEPDVIEYDQARDEYVFCDCSPESPSGRRSICYDRKAQDGRKKNKPDNNALDMATAMGIELLTPEQYRALQELDAFDTKTSSWVQTPPEIRELGGALFGDRRFNTVFIYHNGADSYYAARGFRGTLRV